MLNQFLFSVLEGVVQLAAHPLYFFPTHVFRGKDGVTDTYCAEDRSEKVTFCQKFKKLQKNVKIVNAFYLPLTQILPFMPTHIS